MKIKDISEGWLGHLVRGFTGSKPKSRNSPEELVRRSRERDEFVAKNVTDAFGSMARQLTMPTSGRSTTSAVPKSTSGASTVAARPHTSGNQGTSSPGTSAKIPKLQPGEAVVVSPPNGIKYFYSQSNDSWYAYHGVNWPRDYRTAHKVTAQREVDYLTKSVLDKNYTVMVIDSQVANKARNQKKR